MGILNILANGKKPKKGNSIHIPDDLTEEEKRYVYRNPSGKIVFTPLYEIYNETFFREVVAGTNILTSYSMFKDTAWMEKYTTNLYQFSAAKSVDTARLMQQQVYSPSGELRSWSKFRDAADSIQETSNKVHLRVERDNCARQAIMADKFNKFREDADLYPYWIYVGRMDSRERPEHKALEGLIFRIGDRFGDSMFPPSDWNCRCTGKNIDDMYLRKHNRVVQTNEQARGWLTGLDDDGKPFVDPQFRYNPADQGMLPKVGKYFENFKSANEGNSALFDLEGPHKPELMSSPLENLSELMRQWHTDHHTDRLGNITFQCPPLLSNVVLTHLSTHRIHTHPRGAGMLPETIADPSEVWSRWEDPIAQQVVLRNYITFDGKSSYIVSTRDGAIQDAILLSRGQAVKHRIGVPYIK